MILSKNQYCDIISENNIDNNIIYTFKCNKCSFIFDKFINKKSSTLIKCSKCNNKFVIVPREYNVELDKLVDYYIISYYIYNKHMKMINKKLNKLKVVKDIDLDSYKLFELVNILEEHTK